MSIIRLHHSLVICMFLQSIVTIWGVCTLCGPNKKFPLAQRVFFVVWEAGGAVYGSMVLLGKTGAERNPWQQIYLFSPWTNICRDVSQVMPPRNTFTLSQVCWKSLSGTWSSSVEELLKKKTPWATLPMKLFTNHKGCSSMQDLGLHTPVHRILERFWIESLLTKILWKHDGEQQRRPPSAGKIKVLGPIKTARKHWPPS